MDAIDQKNNTSESKLITYTLEFDQIKLKVKKILENISTNANEIQIQE